VSTLAKDYNAAAYRNMPPKPDIPTFFLPNYWIR